jgi:3-hydroxy-3-methylglutaryl CoA synthase
MVGIVSYGAHIPYHRLSRAEIARAWGTAPQPGEKAVANYDEDSITMSVAAAMDCTTDINEQSIDGLFFASTTSPYLEKLAATIVATAIDLRRDILVADFASSLRSGTMALRAALDAVKAGSANSVLVCAADTRLGYPNGDAEMSFGDGAGALLIGSDKVAVEIENAYSLADEIIDVWRSDKDQFVRSWEDRFVRERGHGRVVPEALGAALKKFNLTAKDFTRLVCYAANPRLLEPIARSFGFDAKTQVQNTLFDSVGNTGSAQAFITLVAALEEAKPGDRILFANYSNGCDVFALKVTTEIENIRNRRGVKRNLAAKRMLNTYQKFIVWRGLVDTQPPARPEPISPSAPALWRDNKGGLALYGAKCKNCGFVVYPAQRICLNCQAKDMGEPYRFARLTGTVTTFSHDNLAASIDPPTTICAVDFPEGGRIMCDMTDRDPSEVKVGMPVEMVFRKIGTSGNIHNYWWKCRPLR